MICTPTWHTTLYLGPSTVHWTGQPGSVAYISYDRKGKEGGGEERLTSGLGTLISSECVDWVWQGDKGQGFQPQPLQ